IFFDPSIPFISLSLSLSLSLSRLWRSSLPYPSSSSYFFLFTSISSLTVLLKRNPPTKVLSRTPYSERYLNFCKTDTVSLIGQQKLSAPAPQTQLYFDVPAGFTVSSQQTHPTFSACSRPTSRTIPKATAS
ncbi:hypothetical protein F2P56_006211, partial [Juglans regia]